MKNPKMTAPRRRWWHAALLGMCLASVALAQTRSPNVVLILADDLGWTDLGSYGSELYRTPNLDRLAREGTRFDRAYSACTVCSPTRAAIMTGRYPAVLRVTDWIAGHVRPFAKLAVPDWTMQLDPREPNLARTLRDAGYATAHMGKWHLGKTPRLGPSIKASISTSAVGVRVNPSAPRPRTAISVPTAIPVWPMVRSANFSTIAWRTRPARSSKKSRPSVFSQSLALPRPHAAPVRA